jgi:ferric-dicitrate binding protein FerR (iron transport regulator)
MASIMTDERDSIVEENARDRIGDLIRLGGPRAAVPADREGRVRSAVHDAWQGQVRRRSRNRRAILGLSAAATVAMAVALGIWQRSITPPGSADAGRVASLIGSAWTRPAAGGEDAAPLRRGQVVASAEYVATGPQGRVTLALASGKSLRIDTSTRLAVLSPTAIDLQEGTVYVDSGIDDAGTEPAIEIRTPQGVVRDIGTQFEVRVVGPSVRVRVREGLAKLDRLGAVHELGPGQQLVVTEGEEPALGDVPLHGPTWAWVEEIAPMLDLRGRTARAFLDWIARERGWELRFADEEVERAAAGIMLSGSIEGLGLDDALDAVLPTCQMSSRVEDGVLIVESEESG